MVFPRACKVPLSRALVLWLSGIPCLLSVCSLPVGVVLQGGRIVVRQWEVPFQGVFPDWEPVATVAPPSLLFWSCFVLSLIPLQGCLLWCLFLCSFKLLGGLEEEDPLFFPGPSFLLKLGDSTFLLCWLPHYEAKGRGSQFHLVFRAVQSGLAHVIKLHSLASWVF